MAPEKMQVNGGWSAYIKFHLPLVITIVAAAVGGTWTVRSSMETRDDADRRTQSILESVKSQREAQLAPLQARIDANTRDIGDIKDDISSIEKDVKTLLTRGGNTP